MNLNFEYDRLDREIEQQDIVTFLERVYEAPGFITQRTVVRWLDELDIDCIQPRPRRNRDIRYAKSDILRLTLEKADNLRRLREKFDRNVERLNTSVRQKAPSPTYPVKLHFFGLTGKLEHQTVADIDRNVQPDDPQFLQQVVDRQEQPLEQHRLGKCFVVVENNKLSPDASGRDPFCHVFYYPERFASIIPKG